MRKDIVLITGATGFIGSHVTERLLQDKTLGIVAILRKNNVNIEGLSKKGVIVIEGNFYDKALVKRVFENHSINYVIHLAALRGAGSKDDYFLINVLGTEYLLEQSHKHRIDKFIFISSVGVYGTIPKETPATLKTELVGDNAYHNSKILAEEKVKNFITRGLNANIVRPTITYGSGDDGFPNTLVEMTKKRHFPLSWQDTKIHLLDVESFANLLWKMIKSSNSDQRIFLVADESPILLRELVNLIHFHFYGTDYPAYLKLPNFIFKLLGAFFRMIRNEKWLTRIQLISRNWHYDIDETISNYKYSPSITKNSFIKSMGI